MESKPTGERYQALTARLAEFDQKIDALTKQLDQLETADAETIASYQRYFDALMIKRKAVALKIEELNATDESLWDTLQAGLDEVWQDLTATLDRAAEEFEAGQRLQDGQSPEP